MATYGSAEWAQQMYGNSNVPTTPTYYGYGTAPNTSLTQSYFDKYMEEYEKRQKQIAQRKEELAAAAKRVAERNAMLAATRNQQQPQGKYFNYYAMTNPYNYVYQTYPQFMSQAPAALHPPTAIGIQHTYTQRPAWSTTYGSQEWAQKTYGSNYYKPPITSNPNVATHFSPANSLIDAFGIQGPGAYVYNTTAPLGQNTNQSYGGWAYPPPADYGGGGGYGRSKSSSQWYNNMVQWNINRPQGG